MTDITGGLKVSQFEDNLGNINTRTIGPKSDSAYDFSLPLNDEELKTLTEIVDER